MTYFNMDKFYWLNDISKTILERGYLNEGVDPIERIKEIGETVEKRKGVSGYADKFHDYMSRGWISLSSPVWANFGLDKGFPISCFSIDIQDNTVDILRAASEIGLMSKYGGGTGGYFGNLRPRGSLISTGGKSDGSVSFMEIFDTVISTISQGNTRRGAFASYLPIDHGDIEEFLTMRDNSSPIQELFPAVTIPYGWMQSMIDGDKQKRKVWAKVLESRTEKGLPYIFFDDNVNNNRPTVYKDKHIKIKHSNLCSEIMLPADENESFVCCLSSVNLLHYDQWKDTDLIETVLILLDAVMEEFIEKASKVPYFEKAVRFAQNHNAVGLGVLGWHSYLQSKMIPMEGLQAKMEINKIFKNIADRCSDTNTKLAELWGEAPILKGYNQRFATTRAVAPTTSSAFILGQVSQSIEPYDSNYYLKDTAKGKFPVKNIYLEKILDEKGKNTDETWESILEKGGSVQHLKFLSDDEKLVFRTFGEMSQLELVQNVSIMQKYIDQGISFNIKVHPDTPVKDLNKLHIEGWKLGVKTFYYQKGVNKAQELNRNLLNCQSCEG